jgi:ankyrin repeat protein
VESGHDVNVQDGRRKQTGLHYAARFRNTAMCRLLLESGADISATDSEGNEPLHEAALSNRGSDAVCELLVAHGANVNAVNNRGNTPLLQALSWDDVVNPLYLPVLWNLESRMEYRSDKIAVVKQLLKGGSDTKVVNKHRQTPLHFAAGDQKDNPALCEVSLRHKAKIDVVDEDGNQPLHIACLNGHLETVKLMVSHGANVDEIDNFGRTPLCLPAYLTVKISPSMLYLLEHRN